MAKISTQPAAAPEAAEAYFRAIDAVRAVLADTAATPAALLATARSPLHADELLFLREREDRLEVTASPAVGRLLVVPAEIRLELLGLSRERPIDDATGRRLAEVLGMRTEDPTAAFCSAAGPLELLLAGWKRHEPPQPVAFAALACFVGLAHDVLATREALVETQLRRERSRWAGEIHDGLTQAVTSGFLELQTLRNRIAVEPAVAIESLDDVMHDMRRALLEVRGVLFDLTDAPEARSGDPMAAYVREVAERWSLTVEVTVEVAVDDNVDALPRRMLSVARMVVREGLANAARHAGANSILVRVEPEQEFLCVEVVDDGRGFDTTDVHERPGHLGLRLLRQRVTEAGGTVRIESEQGRGTRILTHLPISTQGEES